MPLPDTVTNGLATDANPLMRIFNYLYGLSQNIMGTQINANAGIPASAVAATLAGNTTLVDDINDLNTSLGTIVSNQMGTYDAWNEMLPVEGTTLISVSGAAAAQKVDIASGGRIKMMGHDFTTKAITNLCFHDTVDSRNKTNPSGNTAMADNAVYALRLCAGAPGYDAGGANTAPAVTGGSTSAQLQEAGADSTACHWELVRVSTGRFIQGSISSVADSTTGLAPRLTLGISSGGIDLMGARVRLISGAAVGIEFTPPWTSGSDVFFPNVLSATPAVNDKCLINLDLLSRRINNIGVTGLTASPVYRQDQDGASIPQDGLVAIICTFAAGTTPYVMRMPVCGGVYNGNRSMIGESDWTAGGVNAIPSDISFTRPFNGCRIKAVWGLTALHNSVNGMVILRPLSSICPNERTSQNPASAAAEWYQSGWGIEVGIHQDHVTVAMYQEGFANNAWPGGYHDGGGMAANTYAYSSIKCKIFVEFEA